MGVVLGVDLHVELRCDSLDRLYEEYASRWGLEGRVPIWSVDIQSEEG
jgi:hypothetical protein